MAVLDMISLPTWLLGIVAALTLLYFYMTKSFTYWKDKGIPYVPAYPFVGSFASVFKKPFQEVEIERYKKYGKLYGAFEGNNPVLSVADLDLLKYIFVKDFYNFPERRSFKVGDQIINKFMATIGGDDWKRIRSIVTPAFTSGKLKRMVPIMLDCTDSLIKNFETFAQKKQDVDLKKLFGTFTLDVLVSSSFGIKVDSYNDPHNPAVEAARKIFSRNIPWKVFFFFICPRLIKLLGINVLPNQMFQYFIDIAVNAIAERRKSGKKRNDLLQIMLDSAEEVDFGEIDKYTEDGHEEENAKIFKKTSGKSLSHDEIVAQCVMFLVAGYDSSSSTLGIIVYNLALNPEYQEKLIQEIDEVVGGDELTYDNVMKCTYLDQVISESLRMCPPGVRNERTCFEDYKLADTGITIPKGMIVTVPSFCIHQDPEYYPDPLKFDPERFSPENKAKRHPFAYFPFGAGPRNCVGMRFALLQIKIALISLFKKYRFSPSPNTKIPLEFYFGQQVIQPKEIILNVEFRTDV